ncbi:DNA-binding MarR family transcriptional regulator [Isoptericola sp. CG 20/1183]|uniref:DNA-binding MarR family transcriptional regulator n=1 Tax=Isoptericola halotolerans TaxID=300560 RepID=A0ABX5EE98_9MICO|nr:MULTISPECIES: MarR family transcriptional regulator [Isoptericola]PRZ07024.1 DNA-binding MarR family transcriptional regulator [Isoptericola halotolerans]PRZ07304.1 DNA-binding MarR family transcriptional regulator [Isoptericola sp. CG 20/1183]
MSDYPLDATAALPAGEIAAAWDRELPGVPTSSIGVITPLWRAAKRLADERRRTLARLGVDGATLDLLSTLRRSGEPWTLTTRELTTQTLVTAGAVSQRVARAERDGLVARAPSDAGRRAVAVTLTGEGHAVVERVVRELLEHEERLLGVLGADERDALGRLLGALLDSLPGRDGVG